MTLQEWLESKKGTQPGPFKPHVHETEFLVNVYWEGERCYSEPIAGTPIDLFRAMSDDRIVGCRIWRVKEQ